MKFWELYLTTNNEKDPIVFKMNSRIFILVQGSHHHVDIRSNVRVLLEFQDNYKLVSCADRMFKDYWNEEVELMPCVSLVLGIKQQSPTVKDMFDAIQRTS